MKKQKYTTPLKRTDFMTTETLILRPEEPKGWWKTFILYNQEQDYLEEAPFYFTSVESVNIRNMGWSEKWISLGEL